MAVKQPGISQREEDMLRLVYEYKYLSLPLLTRGLGFAMTSINHVGEYAKWLIEKEMLRRFPLPSTTRGTKSFIYTLAPGGVKYLKALGIDDTDGWAHKTIAPSFMHFAHCLATNELLLAAALLPGRIPAITIQSITPDWKLRKSPLRVPGAEGTVLSMIADGLIDVRFTRGNKRLQTTLWLEVDLGTEQQKQLKTKIHALYSIATSPKFLAALGTRAVTIAFATTEGEKRRGVIETWIEQHLTHIGHVHDGDLFLTTSFVAGQVDPIMLYTEHGWHMPFTPEMVPLIDLSV